MKRKAAWAGQALLLSAVCAIATRSPALADALPEPRRAGLLASVKTIGVMPIEVDRVVPNEAEVATSLEQGIIEHLQAAGFTVVPPSAMRAIRSRGQAALGSLYDPMTGVGIADRLKALDEFSQNEYRTFHAVDAILTARVIRRRAGSNVGAVEWDGVRERVSSESGVTAVLQYALGGTKTLVDLQALSLAVKVVDVRGQTRYTRYGGLLALEYPTLSGAQAEYDLTRADPHFSVGDPAIMARALEVAIDPLAGGAPPSKPLTFSVPPIPPPPASRLSALKQLLHGHARLVLAPLETPASLIEQSDSLKLRYGRLLEAKLKALGFETAGNSDYEELWEAERAAAGGFFDPMTGRPNTAELSAARARVLARLHERFNVVAVAISSIVPRTAAYYQGYARWDGASQSVTGGGSVLFNASIFNSNLEYTGDLDAFSLKVRIVDESDQVLFDGTGGIELAQHLDHGSVVPAPETALLTHPAYDSAAVMTAMRALSSARTANGP